MTLFITFLHKVNQICGFDIEKILRNLKQFPLFKPHMYKMDPRGSKRIIFGEYILPKIWRLYFWQIFFPVFFVFFWSLGPKIRIKFTISCEFGPLQVK